MKTAIIIIFLLSSCFSYSRNNYLKIDSIEFENRIKKIENALCKNNQDSLRNIRNDIQESFRKESKDNLNTMIAIIGIGIAVILALLYFPIYQIRQLKKKILAENKTMQDDIIKQKKELEDEVIKQLYELESTVINLRLKVDPLSVEAENIIKILEQRKIDISSLDKISEDTKNKLFELNANIEQRKELGEKLTADDYFYQGFSFYDNEEYQNAFDSWDKALRKNPTNYDALNNKGTALHKLEKYEEAIKCFDKAIELKPDFNEAWNNKGAALDNLGKYEEAIKCYNNSIELKPDYSNAWFNKGTLYGKLKNYENAIICYDKAIEFKPDDYQAWNNRGNVLIYFGKYEDAIKCFDQTILLKPNDSISWFNKARAYSLMKEKNEMLINLKKAIELNNEWKVSAKYNETFKEYWDDPDFKKLVE